MGANLVWLYGVGKCHCAAIFFGHMVAQLTFFRAAIGMPIGYLIVYMTGFSKLMGLMHSPWLALAYGFCGGHTGEFGV